MARVHHVKANKDYPDIGVKKGEMYYHWSPFRRGKRRSKTKPRPSQVSGAKSAVVEDAILDARDTIEGADDVSQITEAIEAVAESAREVAGEYEEVVDATDPQGSGAGGFFREEAEEKKDQLESFADTLDGFSPDETEIEELDEVPENEPDEQKRDREQAREDALSTIRDEATSLLDEFPL